MEFIDLSASAGERIKTGRKIDTNLDGDILLSAEKLQYGVSDLRDINQVSFEIACQKLNIIYGPSGVGKSTLLNMICGYLSPDQGLIKYNRKYFSELNQIPRMFAPSLQDSLMFEGNILENLKFVQPDFNYKSQGKLISSLGLDYLFNEMKSSSDAGKKLVLGTQLSGGEKQRLSILRALISTSKIIVLDEPTSALDRALRNKVMGLIRSECLRGRTFIVVSHDRDLIDFADITIELASNGVTS